MWYVHNNKLNQDMIQSNDRNPTPRFSCLKVTHSWSDKIKLIAVEKYFLLPLGFISIRSTADIFGLICLVSSVFQILINVFAFWPYVIFSNNNKIPRTPNNY